MEVAEPAFVVAMPIATKGSYYGGHSYGGPNVVKDFGVHGSEGVSLACDHLAGSGRYVQIALSKRQCLSYGLAQ